MKSREDITDYPDMELGLRVMNDPMLYHMRHDLGALGDVLRQNYIYTVDQAAWLYEYLADEQEGVLVK
jgi:hypothetical protein